jgi:hypothetical protein
MKSRKTLLKSLQQYLPGAAPHDWVELIVLNSYFMLGVVCLGWTAWELVLFMLAEGFFMVFGFAAQYLYTITLGMLFHPRVKWYDRVFGPPFLLIASFAIAPVIILAIWMVVGIPLIVTAIAIALLSEQSPSGDIPSLLVQLGVDQSTLLENVSLLALFIFIHALYRRIHSQEASVSFLFGEVFDIAKRTWAITLTLAPAIFLALFLGSTKFFLAILLITKLSADCLLLRFSRQDARSVEDGPD